MSAAQDLRHEEIWDDTELVESWNEAVEEYKVRNYVRKIIVL